MFSSKKIKIIFIYCLLFFFIILPIIITSIDNKNTVNKDNITGYEPVYNPKKWNNLPFQYSHNCYEYALDDFTDKDAKLCESAYRICKKIPCYNRSGERLYDMGQICRALHLKSQPGYIRGYPSVKTDQINCKTYNKRTLADNPDIYPVKSNNIRCKKGFYKIALVVGPKQSYHYYLQNKNGYWSHKDGGSEATNLDQNGNKIIDPKYASRKYPDFCGYYCVPSNNNIKTYHSNSPLYKKKL